MVIISRRIAVLLALVATTAVGCESPQERSPTPTTTAAVSGSPAGSEVAVAPTLQPIELRQLGLCESECEVTGSIPLIHPAWGRVWLMTVRIGDVGATDPSLTFATSLIAIGSDLKVYWQWTGSDWPVFQPAKPSTDATGHLFIRYNSGRYDGLLVLAPVPSGFGHFGTLPTEEQMPTSRFYGGTPVDRDGDGTLEIRVDLNTCEPNCAEGNYVTEFHRWNGSDYVPD